MNSRRKFITTAALTAITAKSSIYAFNDVQDQLFIDRDADKYNQSSIISPKLLQKGDKVAITAPASPTNKTESRYGARFIKENGCDVVYGETVSKQMNKYRYLSAPDNVRAEEFMSFIKDPEINAIFCARGGYGSIRILDLLDYDVIRDNPKIILGFSDITSLLLAIYKISGLTTFHGPVASMNLNSYTKQNLLHTIFKNENSKFTAQNSFEVLVDGTAKGNLVGGNLSTVISTLGTPYEINTKDSILFLEDVSEDAYKIDRMLNHLKIAGKFNDANGIVFGQFKNLRARRPFYPNRGFSILEVINDLLKPLKKPVIYNLPFGHVSSQLTLPLGKEAYFDTTNLSFGFSTV